ncbi:low molecular weight protein-tyrosine-phosphatase [Alkalicoccus chagannorensis]|uniref:low molecular weight protein-tyrosine-phosphatase n=1 Tax=Alkalicoccus chagannorensis TaxID=427072 RepID=UPI000400C270|nr:low molecular weight protein-tyrosine-phosphatase [Alkalicoccus chagannorensis]
MKIVFVCLGNICRSPMAEAVFRQWLEAAQLTGVTVDSAGTGNWHEGSEPHEGTLHLLEQEGIDASGMEARILSQKDFQSDYLIAMDAETAGTLHSLKGSGTGGAAVFRLLDFADSEEEDVPDPYFTGDFEETYKLILQGCSGLFHELFPDASERV